MTNSATGVPVGTLNGGGPEPLHQQLRETLLRDIESGRYRPGDRILSERELCQEYGVSRTTVRQAINDLVHQGRLLRVPAKGTFVAPPKIHQELSYVTRFSDTVSRAGRVPSTRLLSVTRVTLPNHAKTVFDLQTDDAVCLELVGYADDEPLAYYRVYLPATIGLPVAHALTHAQYQQRLTFGMILDYLKQFYGLIPTFVDQTFEAQVADDSVARILRVTPDQAVFASTRIIYTAQGQPIEYDEIFYRGDRYRFSIRRIYNASGGPIIPTPTQRG
jgi:GntR family transcriptional regulator